MATNDYVEMVDYLRNQLLFHVPRERKEMVDYLLSVHLPQDPAGTPSTIVSGSLAAKLICAIIRAGYYDVAVSLVEAFPGLVTQKNEFGVSAIKVMAQRWFAFTDYSTIWERMIYKVIDIEDPLKIAHSDKEDTRSSGGLRIARHIQKAPFVKKLLEKKVMQKQALVLVQKMCLSLGSLGTPELLKFLKESDLLQVAIEKGSVEFVAEFLRVFPDAIWFVLGNDKTMLQIAIEERNEAILKLILGSMNSLLVSWRDDEGNSILHLAAKLAPPHKLIEIPGGAVFQMRQDLKWFKMVKSMIPKQDRLIKNSNQETAAAIFTKEHKGLVEEGKMSLTSASKYLLIPMGFVSGAISVLGGTYNSRPRNLSLIYSCTLFPALFSSVTSVSMFVSILTSRYAEEEFLTSLPLKWVIGLVTSLLTIFMMLISFTATMVLEPGLGNQVDWIVAFVVIPVVLVLAFSLAVKPIIRLLSFKYGRTGKKTFMAV